MLAIGSHLRDVCGDKRRLNLEINLAGSLQIDSSVRRPVFLGEAGLGKRVVLNLDVNLAFDGAHGSQAIDFRRELRQVRISQRPQQRRCLYGMLNAEQTAAAHHQQAQRNYEKAGDARMMSFRQRE